MKTLATRGAVLSTWLILSPLAGGCGPQATATPSPGAELQVLQEPLLIRHLLSGQIAAENAVVIVAPPGNPTQVRWLVENGAEVSAGDPIVELDNASLASNLDQLEAAVSQAASALDRARSKAAADLATARLQVFQSSAALEKAQIEAEIPDGLKAARDYEKLQVAAQRAQLELEEAQRGLEAKRESTQAEISMAALGLEKAEFKLRHAEETLQKLTLRAPTAGIVLIEENPAEDRIWQEGDNAFPGWKIARIPDLSALIVEARLFDVDDDAIAPDLEATITLDAYADLRFSGRVREVGETARQDGWRSLTRAFRVVVEIDDLDPERMRPGMSAKVAVERALMKGADGEPPLLIPRQALDLGTPGGPRARLADGSWRRVALGPCNAQRCVLQEGLSLGDRLASAPPRWQP